MSENTPIVKLVPVELNGQTCWVTPKRRREILKILKLAAEKGNAQN